MSEKIEFKSSQRINLVGILHSPEKETDSVVVLAHGFTSNKDRQRTIDMANALVKKGTAVFRFDFRGSGDSDDGVITIEGEVDDLLAAIKLMKSKGYKKIGLLGESLGGFVVLKAFGKDIQAIVLWAPVTTASEKNKSFSEDKRWGRDRDGNYIRQKDGREFKISEQYFRERQNFDREKVMGRITVPVLIVHGTADDIVPLKGSREATKLLPKDSRLEVIENKGFDDHKMDKSMDKIISLTLSWFSNHLV